jgi:hypothetical protein
MKLKDKETGEIIEMTLKNVIDMINADRNEEWQPYDDSDWMDGLAFTPYETVDAPRMKLYEVVFIEKVYHHAIIEAESEEEAKKGAEEALRYGEEAFYQESESFEFLWCDEQEENEFSYHPRFDREGKYLGKVIDPKFRNKENKDG